jgi:hypothetical protein
MKSISIQQYDQLLVLQQVIELGEETFEYIARSLQLNYESLANILQDLHRKGLVVARTTNKRLWVRASARGKKWYHKLNRHE